ncbi:hypothetical protein [Pseudaestuariivita atlantica]|uniref:Sulfotransferase family protein n=1 Tax=Pseudaestuariivita atlantica TaxID=1317121 RepID=A0A0L1JLW4_9RHOB|nr:hypothetical protein [Pseudaestuariivita atlantica]KNG92393.1 hypothetical protein ATO11_17440 [Pseudaestuariivita atlantica]
MTLKVVNLGLPKTGTTTLARALGRASLKVADHRIKPEQTGNAALHHSFVGVQMYRDFFDTGDPLHTMAEFDAFTEISTITGPRSYWPQTDWALIDAIRKHHPGVKFVASWREPQDLSDAMLRWRNLGTERLPAGNIPGLPKGFGDTHAERKRWIEGHYAHLDRLFAGDADYLRYDLADDNAPRLIAAHIGRDLPWWGRANVNRHKLDDVSP